MSQLTDDEWQRVAPLLKNIDENRQAAAYNRLVKGMTFAAAGQPWGYSRQDVYHVVKSVLDWYDRLNTTPDKPRPPKGWVSLEVFVPRNRVDEVRRIVEAMCPLPGTPQVQESKAAHEAAAPRAKTAK